MMIDEVKKAHTRHPESLAEGCFGFTATPAARRGKACEMSLDSFERLLVQKIPEKREMLAR